MFAQNMEFLVTTHMMVSIIFLYFSHDSQQVIEIPI